LGQLINTISQEKKQRGFYQIEVLFANMPAGLYYCTLFIDGEKTDAKKLIVNN